MSVNNRLLFSEIFFKQIRRETADLANLLATLATIRDTWRYFFHPPEDGAGPRWQPDAPINLDDVAALRDNVIQPIFGALELTYGPCDTGAALSPHLSPFFLYGDWAMQERAGLCLVLPYSADIEGRDASGRIPKGRNYAQQLLRLLREHDLDWGVLTNGRHWRLYHRTELSPTDTYLHLDLEQIVAANDIESYVIFHRFFSRSAFEQHDGRQRLSQYKQQSDQASKVIEGHLSSHVEEIARQLCQGLVESCRAAGEDVTTPGTRKEIYKNALYLVYRLLFVLYAEARDLLPLDIAAYRAVCLRDLLAEVRENHWNGLHYINDHAIWERLQRLFALIDQGDKLAGVPAYNGGLFDPGRRPFLTGHRIENAYLQAALIRLSTMPAQGLTYDQDREPTPIDYRDLSVRHLGSLYEGLLEYNLFEVKDEPRVVRAGNKCTEYVPYSQAGKVRAGETVLKVGDVYFSETEGERKATGSYYTPEDVVDYIVRDTVMIKLAALRAEFYKAKGIERQLQDLADIPPDLPAHRQIQLELDRQFMRFVSEQVLNLRTLDMAMGSGHFLVNATHAVANFIVEFLNETPWENEEIDTDIATWRRRVAERCIFGVDLNELAVELAKLCLWMTTAAKGKPLTFLDHHLRWGNSLVGAWMKDVGVYPLTKKRDKPAFTLPLGTFQVALDRVLDGYRELYALDSDDVEEVRQKARIYDQEIRPILERYRELFDLHTGVYLYSDLDETAYAQLGAAVQIAEVWTKTKANLKLENTLKGYQDQHWFHWELEFPEVLAVTGYGFSAVIGNPPYVEIPALPYALPWLMTNRCGNTYASFFEICLRTASPCGAYGLVVPISIVSTERMSPLQELLREHSALLRVANFAVRPATLFPGVDMNISIVTGIKSDEQVRVKPCQCLTSSYLRWFPNERPGLLQRVTFVDSTQFVGVNRIPKLGSVLEQAILAKLRTDQTTLADSLDPEHGKMLHYHSGGRYWRKAILERLSSEYKPLKVKEEFFGAVLSLLNSSLFYWYWIVFSDCYHVVQSDVCDFPINCSSFSKAELDELESLATELLQDYEIYASTILRGRGRAEKVQKQFYPAKSKPIIDKIDRIFGAHFGFTSEEQNYIIGFDRRFRGLDG